MKKNEPNYERLRTALYWGQPDRVPLLELHIDPSIQEKFLGRPVCTVADTVDFYIQADPSYYKKHPLSLEIKTIVFNLYLNFSNN
jgi:hypothetical protein